MKKLDRYVLRELMVPFLIGTVAVLLMFEANMLIYQLKTFSLSAVPPEALGQLVLFRAPGYLMMTLPVGTALAASLAVSRLTRESELTAMRSAGASVLRIVLPVAAFGLLVSVGEFLITERVMPTSEKRARSLQTQLALLGSAPDFKSNVVVNLRNFVANFGSVSRGRGDVIQLSHILLIERPRVGEVQVITADSGEYRAGIWTIRNFRAWIVKEEDFTTVERLKRTQKDMVINDPISVEEFFATPMPEEQTAEQLKLAIAEGKKTGINTTSMEVAYHVRFAIPATCVIFALVAPVFAVGFARTGGFMGVLLSIILVFLYYNAHIISTEVLGRTGLISPWLSAWLPNFVFVVLGVIGIRRLE